MSNIWNEDVLDFWFGELTQQDWFAGGDDLDRRIAERFAGLHAELSKAVPADALLEGEAALAAIIVLDQFSRNMFRGSAKAFAQDSLALALTHNALRAGFDQALDLDNDHKQFLIMPLMHSEALSDQDLCVSLFAAMGSENSLKFAREHRDTIAEFGRFPHRNDVLGRVTTPEERAYLETANRYGQ